MSGEVWSLHDFFKDLPVAPELFESFRKGNAELYWLGKCLEEHHCSTCGTTTPTIPKSHHTQCFDHRDAESFPEPAKSILGDCPSCKDEDSLTLVSSREMQLSVIYCTSCDFRFQGRYREEALITKFNKKFRRNNEHR